jgi:hypothetical protein
MQSGCDRPSLRTHVRNIVERLGFKKWFVPVGAFSLLWSTEECFDGKITQNVPALILIEASKLVKGNGPLILFKDWH